MLYCKVIIITFKQRTFMQLFICIYEISEFLCLFFVAFVCPGALQYQACLPACAAPSCPNKEFEYDAVQCSGMSEGCMCPEGTVLHRPYSALCISPVKCGMLYLTFISILYL